MFKVPTIQTLPPTTTQVETFPAVVVDTLPPKLSKSPFEQLIKNIRRPLREDNNSIEKFFSKKEISSKQVKVTFVDKQSFYFIYLIKLLIYIFKTRLRIRTARAVKLFQTWEIGLTADLGQLGQFWMNRYILFLSFFF